MIDYREYLPHQQLAPYVECYWLSTGNTGPVALSYGILPDRCCDILINLGDPVIGDNSNLSRHTAYIIGAATKYSEISVKGNIAICGIRFKPLGLLPFLGNTALGDFKNDAIDISLVNKFTFDRIFEGQEVSAATLSGQLDAFLLKLMQPGYGYSDVVSAAISHINQRKGVIKMAQLAGLVHTSGRNLERLFHKHIGLTPKEFSKVTRLSNIKQELITNAHKSLAQIAYEYDYYDSAHFTKDFINFAGSAPSRL